MQVEVFYWEEVIDTKFLFRVVAEEIVALEVLVLYTFTHINHNYRENSLLIILIAVQNMRTLLFYTGILPCLGANTYFFQQNCF